MGSAEKFCLRWNDFESNISIAFRELRDDKDFFDVTLVCSSGQIQAHKVILSACSPFFRSVLKKNPHHHPLLYLKGVHYNDLQAVLNFMYHGEVNVAQEDLNSFLSISEDLKVKGLTKNNTESPVQSIPPNRQREIPERTIPCPEERIPKVPVPPPAQTSTPCQPVYQESFDEIQEVVPVKAEQVAVDTIYEDTDYGDYGGCDVYDDTNEQAYGREMVSSDIPSNHQGRAMNNPSPQERANMFLVHMTMVMDGAVKKWQCVLCGKMAKLKADILDHVEAKHMENSFQYHCRYCTKVLNTNGNLRTHEYQHRCNERQTT